jgi:mono/diheme cytochrome c family protein
MLIELLRKTAAIFAAVALLTALSTANARAADEHNDGADQAQIEHGKASYTKNCSHCHGPNLVNPGTVTPDLRGFPDDKTRFVTTVKQGKNNRMPPWGDILSDEEITDLWAYISSRRRQ